MIEQVRISKVARYTGDYAPKPVYEADGDTLVLYRCDEGKGNTLQVAEEMPALKAPPAKRQS